MGINQGFPIIRTKITIPAIRPGSIHRGNLTDRIEKGIDQGFILISAPPGYGKTTLAADWAQNKKSPVGWITLDQKDNDLLVLNRYFIALVEQLDASRQTDPVEFSIENSASDNFHSLLITLINECTHLDSEFTLVLDDYQIIQNSRIHDGLLFLLDYFPMHFRLIIITRSDPPLPLARLRANNRILDIRSNDLCFSESETGKFFDQTARLNLSADDIKQAHRRTEGWITGLQLEAIAQSQPSSLRLPKNASSENPKLTMEYMIEEVFYHQSPIIQDFLIKTSILDNLYGPLCDHLLNSQNSTEKSQSLLHSLYHSNLFLTPLDQQELWFRYHPLFSQALRSLLHEKYPTEIQNLYARASEWCDQNGLYEEALNYASQANDKPRYLNLLEKYSLFAINNGSILDTLGWIKRIDESLVATSSILSLIMSWGLMMSVELEISTFWLEKSRELLTAGKTSDVLAPFENDLWGLNYAAQSMLFALQGDIDQALTTSNQALQLLPKENSFSHCFALLNRGFTYSLNGELDEAIRLFEEAIPASQKSGNWVTLLIARSNLAELFINKGRLSKAMVLFQQSLKYLTDSSEKASGFRGYLYKEIGEVYMIRNELDKADKYLHEGAELTRGWLPSLNDLDTHIRLAHLYHCQANHATSKEEIALARSLADASQGQLDDLIIDIAENRLTLLRGQTSIALNWTQKQGLLKDDYLSSIKKLPVALAVPMCLILARLFLVQGRQVNDHNHIERAVQVLISLLPLVENSGLVEYQIEGFTLLALAYHELGKMDEMVSVLEKAFVLAEPEGIRQVFLDEGIPMARVVTHYLAYLKQNKTADGIPSRAFLSDLLYRFTGKEVEPVLTKSPVTTVKSEDPFLADMLTTRETEVITLVAAGKTNGQIAEQLHLSINTVKRHLNNIFLKLGVSTRTQAILVARKQGWIH